MLSTRNVADTNPIADSIQYGQPSCSRIYGLEGHDDQVICCAVAGKTLYTGALDRKIKAWTIKEQGEPEKPLHTYSDHLRGIRCVHAEENYLYSGAGDSFAKMWDTSTRTVQQTFSGHQAQVMAVKSDPFSNKVYTGSFDKTARQWDKETGKCTEQFTGHDEGLASLCLHDGKLITSSADCLIKMWDPRVGGKPEDVVREFKGHSKVVTNVIICDGTLVSGSLDRSVTQWDLGKGEAIRDVIQSSRDAGEDPAIEAQASGPITSICSSTSGGTPMLYTAASNHAKSEQGIVREWDLKTGKSTKMVKIGAAIPWCVCVEYGNLFVTCDDKMTKMWELKKAESVGTRGCGTCAVPGGDECVVS